jgi:hypothetical protein
MVALDLIEHRDSITHRLGAIPKNDRSMQSIQPDIAMRLELHGRHLKQCGAVFEAVLGGDFLRQTIRRREGNGKQILKGIAVLVFGHPSK